MSTSVTQDTKRRKHVQVGLADSDWTGAAGCTDDTGCTGATGCTCSTDMPGPASGESRKDKRAYKQTTENNGPR